MSANLKKMEMKMDIIQADPIKSRAIKHYQKKMGGARSFMDLVEFAELPTSFFTKLAFFDSQDWMVLGACQEQEVENMMEDSKKVKKVLTEAEFKKVNEDGWSKKLTYDLYQAMSPLANSY